MRMYLAVLLLSAIGIAVVLIKRRDNTNKQSDISDIVIEKAFVDQITLSSLKKWINARQDVINDGGKIAVIDKKWFNVLEHSEVKELKKHLSDEDEELLIASVDKNGSLTELLSIKYYTISDDVIRLLGDEHMVVIK